VVVASCRKSANIKDAAPGFEGSVNSFRWPGKNWQEEPDTVLR
jgi:hypothetical protein